MKTKIISGLKNYFQKNNFHKAVIGLSGGVDSAVCLALTLEALGAENVTALFMPEESLTSEENKIDALALAAQLKVKIEIIPINPHLQHSNNFPWLQNKISKLNLKPRIRMLILYNYANANQAIVIGTSNKSEIYLGYGTKHGDCAADILPIGDLYKTEVFSLAKELKIPEIIINKKPSAELLAGQTDEEELGISYEQADKILADYLDNDLHEQKLIEKYEAYNVQLVLSKIKLHEHKRTLTPIIKKSKTALFIGRFQPFHLGHLDAIKQISNECDHVIIAIGSAQYSKNSNNHFSYQERKEQIKGILGNSFNYEIFPIEDIHDPPAWVNHLNNNVPRYDYVFTSNGFVEDLFSEQNIPVKRLKFNIKISGEEIRNMLNEGNENWKKFVPKSIVSYFESKN